MEDRHATRLRTSGLASPSGQVGLDHVGFDVRAGTRTWFCAVWVDGATPCTLGAGAGEDNEGDGGELYDLRVLGKDEQAEQQACPRFEGHQGRPVRAGRTPVLIYLCVRRPSSYLLRPAAIPPFFPRPDWRGRSWSEYHEALIGARRLHT
jgi:hypothetical protein